VRHRYRHRYDRPALRERHFQTSCTGRRSSRRLVVERSGRAAAGHVADVERSNLTLRMSSKRFARLNNGCSKRLENHCAAISL